MTDIELPWKRNDGCPRHIRQNYRRWHEQKLQSNPTSGFIIGDRNINKFPWRHLCIKYDVLKSYIYIYIYTMVIIYTCKLEVLSKSSLMCVYEHQSDIVCVVPCISYHVITFSIPCIFYTSCQLNHKKILIFCRIVMISKLFMKINTIKKLFAKLLCIISTCSINCVTLNILWIENIQATQKSRP